MRITKKVLREAKIELDYRMNELCAILATGGIKSELQRCFPVYISEPTPDRDSECLRMLLYDALEKSIPSHWYE